MLKSSFKVKQKRSKKKKSKKRDGRTWDKLESVLGTSE